MKRILGNIVAFLSIYLLPWWVTVAVLLLFIFFFDRFYEAIVYAFIFDLLYKSGTGFFSFKITLIILIAFLVIEWLKKYLKFY